MTFAIYIPLYYIHCVARCAMYKTEAIDKKPHGDHCQIQSKGLVVMVYSPLILAGVAFF
jgi:hypothetical protein